MTGDFNLDYLRAGFEQGRAVGVAPGFFIQHDVTRDEAALVVKLRPRSGSNPARIGAI
jgi:hypothetical protein